jgi:hypothetical protein
MGEGEGGGGQKNQFSPSPSSPPTRGGEIFGGPFLNVRDKFSDFISKNLKYLILKFGFNQTTVSPF